MKFYDFLYEVFMIDVVIEVKIIGDFIDFMFSEMVSLLDIDFVNR